MKRLITTLMFVVFLLAVSCTPDRNVASSAIQDMGLDNVDLGGHAWYGCPEDYNCSQTFTARQPANGRRVNGIVCVVTSGEVVR